MRVRTRDIRVLRDLPPDTGSGFHDSIREEWAELVDQLADTIEELYENDVEQQLPPGTIILSARQGHNSDRPVPGFILWEDGLRLSKTRFAALYDVIGETLGSDADTFVLPAVSDRFFQVGAPGAILNRGDTITAGSGLASIKVLVLIKT